MAFDDPNHGWCNHATYLAHTYLNNDPEWHKRVAACGGKGHVTATDCHQRFRELASASPEQYTMPRSYGHVGWREVAAEFNRTWQT